MRCCRRCPTCRFSSRFAVTGSVNQWGEVQAIGGVNEKIEGFFDVCRARGLTGAQGVLIPASNVQHLMLREDVVEAVAKKQFSIHAVAHHRRGHRDPDRASRPASATPTGAFLRPPSTGWWRTRSGRSPSAAGPSRASREPRWRTERRKP